MNSAGLKSWIKTLGTLRGGLLLVAVIAKVLLYIFDPPLFISKTPLLLPFPYLVALDFVSAVVASVIIVECLRILAYRFTSSWALSKHCAAVFAFVFLFLAAKVFFASEASNLYYRYAWSLVKKKDYPRAMRSLDIAIKYDPKNMQPYLERAYLRMRLGDFAAALNDCHNAIALAPKYAGAYACRGYAYYYLCDRDRALVEWDKAISLDANRSGKLDKWIKAVKDPSYQCRPS